MFVESFCASRLFFSFTSQPTEQQGLRVVVNCVALAILFALVVYQVWDYCFPNREVTRQDSLDSLEDPDETTFEDEGCLKLSNSLEESEKWADFEAGWVANNLGGSTDRHNRSTPGFFLWFKSKF